MYGLGWCIKEALKYDYDEVSEDGEFIVNVANRCIVILEKDESFAFIRRMKPLMSGDDTELVWKTPIKNEMTVKLKTRDFIIRGQPSFITLTTRNPSEAEQITRQLLMTPETTPDKIENVVVNTLMAKARPEDLSIHPDLHLLQASMLKLKQRKTRNIFAPLMAEFSSHICEPPKGHQQKFCQSLTRLHFFTRSKGRHTRLTKPHTY